jgi:DNA-binding transcriptional MerR regulator/methylmalonyl-CoA mutase cobalamin-binding subunit
MSIPADALPAGATSEVTFTIAAVERDTRISKDTLRIWERRYGFPLPSRDSNGERLYTQDQIERLRHVKRLMDAGHRPGRIVALELAELRRLGEHRDTLAEPVLSKSTADITGVEDRLAADLLDLLRSHEPRALRRALLQQLLIRGLARFIGEVVAPLLGEVGMAWSRGRLEVFEEHLCSEILESVLRGAITSLPEPPAQATPRVLLATLPIEAHGLGLLMAEALLTTAGCDCMNLGRQTPLSDVVMAARGFRADIVALSFSTAVNTNQAIEALADLRAALPAEVELWAGCTLPAMQRRSGADVQVFSRLGDIELQVARWRNNVGTNQPHRTTGIPDR